MTMMNDDEIENMKRFSEAMLLTKLPPETL